jgi:hypothetical protein
MPEQTIGRVVVDPGLKHIRSRRRRLQAEHIQLHAPVALGRPDLVVLLRPIRPVVVAADRAERRIVARPAATVAVGDTDADDGLMIDDERVEADAKRVRRADGQHQIRAAALSRQMIASRQSHAGLVHLHLMSSFSIGSSITCPPPSSLSERTNEVGQSGDYQPHFGHYRGAGRLWRPPTHPRWVRKRYFNHLSDKLLELP